MIITLKSETERLINEELKSGHYKDAEEVIQRALQTSTLPTRPHLARCKSARRRLPVSANCVEA